MSDRHERHDRHDRYDDVGSDDLDELLGAYALDAVDPDERRRIDDYLAANPRAAAEVQQHREVATMLAYTGSDAPDGVWDRIVASIEEPPPAPGPDLARVMPLDEGRRRRSRLAAFGRWSLATAAAAVIAISAVLVITRDDGIDDPLLAAVDAARADRDSRTAELVSADSDVAVEVVVDEIGRGYLLGDVLPQLPRDLTYQLWGVVGDDVISIGILGPNPEIVTFTARADVAAIAITIEPEGGVISDGNPDGAYVGELT